MIANKSSLARAWMTQGKLVSISTKTTQAPLSFWVCRATAWSYGSLCTWYQQRLPPWVSTCSSDSPRYWKCRPPSRLSRALGSELLPEGLSGGERLQVGTHQQEWHPRMHPAREGIPWENRGSRVGLPRVLDMPQPDLPPGLRTSQEQTVNLCPAFGGVQKFPLNTVCYFQMLVLSHQTDTTTILSHFSYSQDLVVLWPIISWNCIFCKLGRTSDHVQTITCWNRSSSMESWPGLAVYGSSVQIQCLQDSPQAHHSTLSEDLETHKKLAQLFQYESTKKLWTQENVLANGFHLV